MLGGFLSGFTQRLGELQQQHAQENAARAARDQRVLEMLANSDDDEVRSLATTAMLLGPSSRTNFWGKAESHPLLGTIRSLIATPVQTQETVGGQPLAHLPASSPVEPGSAPMNMAALTGVDPSNGGGNVEAPRLPSHVPNLEGIASPIETRTVSHPRQVFLSPTAAEQARVAAGIRGRIQGLIGGAQDAHVPLTAEDQVAIVRGAAGAPQRVIPPKPVTLQLTDGSMVAGFATAEGQFTDANGTLLTNVERIVPPNAGTTGNTSVKVRDPQSPTGYSSVRYDAAGNELFRVPGVPAPTVPPMFSSVVPTEGGAYGVTRGGVARPIPGLPGPAVTPETSAAALRALGAEMDRRYAARLTKLGGLTLLDGDKEVTPQTTQAVYDEIARQYGYPDYATFQGQLATTTQDTTTRVPPSGGAGTPKPRPAGKVGTPPPVADPSDPDGLRKYLPKPGGGQ